MEGWREGGRGIWCVHVCASGVRDESDDPLMEEEEEEEECRDSMNGFDWAPHQKSCDGLIYSGGVDHGLANSCQRHRTVIVKASYPTKAYGWPISFLGRQVADVKDVVAPVEKKKGKSRTKKIVSKSYTWGRCVWVGGM